jgi:uncharacterized ParB-like nuclease family protein
MAKNKAKVIDLDKIELAAAMQARTAIRTATVQEYAEAMRAGIEFPPIDVMPVEGHETNHLYCVIDGWHRVQAARETGATAIHAIVHPHGTESDAMWMAAAANISHGLRRTNADKARAVTLAIAAKPDATYEQIAAQCGVSASMVASYFAAMQQVDDANAAQQDEPVAVQHERQAHPKAKARFEQRMTEAEARIGTVLQELARVQDLVTELVEQDHGAYINAQSVLSDLANASGALQHARPHKACPVCSGAGCETCRMLGWVSKKQWQLIPAAMRGR